MRRRLALGLASSLITGAASAVPPELTELPDVWAIGLGLHAQPEQRRDYACNRGLDCRSPTQAFVAGSLRGSYERPEVWSSTLTLSLGHGSDFEDRPRGGYEILSLEAEVQLELGRRRGEIGAALRVSEALALGWSEAGGAFGIDFPGLAVLVGTRELWGEVGIPTLPTQADPRQFHAGVGWRGDGFGLDAAVATFGSLGYQHDVIDRAGSNFGVWVAGTLELGSGWQGGAQLAIGYPFVFGLSIAYRVASER